MPKRKLGRTGERLSIVGMGGIVVVGSPQNEADRIVREAIGRGVNYFDVAPTYGNGEAEEKLGNALAGYRDKVFLACKTTVRDREGARKELETSLSRLRTDHFDLYQLHALTTKDDVEKALGVGGAIEAFLKAREEGKVRFLGFSAHSVEAALMAIDRFDFDTVLFPFNWVCFYRGNFGPQVVKAARAKKMGLLALKAMARSPWPEGVKRDYPKCWYQPVSDPAEAELALRFTLSEPITAAVPPGEYRLFQMALSIAARFKRLGRKERELLQAKAAELQPIFRYPHNA
ncbi:MAG: aldo/keto reductase [Verrucomicrobiota bacterium]|nr:aldo/keto reductase [Verrucomicrobiota bacterium]